MRISECLSVLLLLSFFSASAQHPSMASFGFMLGGDIEMPHGLDHKYLLRTADQIDFNYDDLAYTDGEMIAMDCDNGTFRFNFSLQPAGAEHARLQFSILSIDSRIDQVHYEFPEGDPRHGKFLNVSATNKELALEGVFLLREQTGKTFVFYAGAGTNIGYAHDGAVHVTGFLETGQASDDPQLLEPVDLTFDQKNSINQRLFLQAGMGLKFLKRLEFGMYCRKGLGYRATVDGPFKMTTLKTSFSLGLQYNIL